MKWQQISLLCGAFLLLIGIGVAGTVIHFLNTPLLKRTAGASGDVLIVDIPPHQSVKQLAGILHQKGVLSRPAYFVWYARFRGDARYIQAGEYALSYTATPRAILKQWVKGDVHQHTLTIVEGQRLSDLLASMRANPNLIHTLGDRRSPQTCHRLTPLMGMDTSVVTQSLVRAKVTCHVDGNIASLEGLLYPDTYAFPKGTTDIAFLRRAYVRMQDVLADAWANRAPNLPYKQAYQALVLASLVEKETHIPQEKPIIAGIIVNRLKRGMPLQIDAAVLYGVNQATGQNKHKLTRSDLRFDTPYNTYLHRGIPPTPIAFTSLASIEAVLHPALTQNLYYVAKGDGSHFFSKTYQAQRQAVIQYQLKKNPQPTTATGAK